MFVRAFFFQQTVQIYSVPNHIYPLTYFPNDRRRLWFQLFKYTHAKTVTLSSSANSHTTPNRRYCAFRSHSDSSATPRFSPGPFARTLYLTFSQSHTRRGGMAAKHESRCWAICINIGGVPHTDLLGSILCVYRFILNAKSTARRNRKIPSRVFGFDWLLFVLDLWRSSLPCGGEATIRRKRKTRAASQKMCRDVVDADSVKNNISMKSEWELVFVEAVNNGDQKISLDSTIDDQSGWILNSHLIQFALETIIWRKSKLEQTSFC